MTASLRSSKRRSATIPDRSLFTVGPRTGHVLAKSRSPARMYSQKHEGDFLPLMLAFSLFLVATAPIVALINHLSLRSWRRAADLHWTERARRLHPIRRSAVSMMFFFPVSAALVAYFSPYQLSVAGAAVGAYVGTVLAGSVVDRAAFPHWGFRSWLGFAASVMLQNSLGWAVLFLGMLLMPEPLDVRAVWIACGYVVVSLSFAWLPVSKIRRLLTHVRPAGPRLSAIVAEASAATGIPVRATWEIDVPVQNAAAFVITRELAFTRPMLDTHDDAALRSICLHEVGHLAEPKWLALVRATVRPVSNIPWLFLVPVLTGPVPFGVVGLWLIHYLIHAAYNRLSVRLEKRADLYAVERSPDPAIYARALERLHEANQIPMVYPQGAAMTHPDHYDRMVDAGLTPDYPRPEPPESHTPIGIALQVLLGVALGLFLVMK